MRVACARVFVYVCASARARVRERESLFACWLLNVPATCECISGTDLLRQF